MPKLAQFENTENPEKNQVDNFSISDGEADQPVCKGPQTRSHIRKLTKANCLMANLFDIESGELCNDVSDILITADEPNLPVESFRTLSLEFWYKQVFTIYCVCCDMAEAGAHSIYC